MLVKQAYDEFVLSLRAEGKSKATIDWYISLVGAFAAQSGELSSITATDVRRYLAELRERAPARGSRNEQISADTLYANHRALNTFFEWASREYGIANPMANIKRPKRPKANPRHVKQNDMVAMFDVASLRDKVIIALLTDTGCRVGDLCQLRWRDIDLDAGYAQVVGKGDKPRLLLLSRFTRDLLQQWHSQRDRQTEHVLYGRIEDTMTRWGISRALKRLAAAAGVEGRYNAHAFRHGFAYVYLAQGGNIAALSKILGHASVAFTLETYGLFDMAATRDSHEKYSAIRGLEAGMNKKNSPSD